jgi:hypothetical protein
MGAIGNTVLTLADWAKRLDPDGKVPSIVELLSQTNEIIADMLWKEGNLPTGERVTVRTGLPTVAWRLLNRGVAKSKSTTAQIDEQCGLMEARSEVDVEIANLNGNVGAFRLSEAQAFVEAMNQEMASTLFYGNSGVAPEEFTGLAPRYSSLSADNAQNIVAGGGAGADNTSIWLVVWGQNTVYGMFPKGSKAGLEHKDLGEGDAFDSNNNRFRAYMDQWKWKPGITLKDWRYVVRIPNIDVSNLVAKSSAADLVELMIKAMHRIPNLKMGKPVFYMNRTVFQMLDIQRRDDAISGAGLVKYENVDGMLIPHFRGIPIKTCDAILETEDLVS